MSNIRPMPFVMNSGGGQYFAAGEHIFDLHTQANLPDERLGLVGEYVVFAMFTASITAGDATISVRTLAGDVCAAVGAGVGTLEKVAFGVTGPVNDVDPQGFELRVEASGTNPAGDVNATVLAVSTPYPPLFGTSWQQA